MMFNMHGDGSMFFPGRILRDVTLPEECQSRILTGIPTGYENPLCTKLVDAGSIALKSHQSTNIYQLFHLLTYIYPVFSAIKILDNIGE